MEDVAEKEEDKKAKNWKKILIIIFLILLMLLTAGFFVMRSRGTEEEGIVAVKEAPVKEETVAETEIDDANIFKDREEDDLTSEEEWSGMSSSENYRINQVRFGGDVALVDGQQKNISLKLSDIKSEMVTSVEDEEPRFLLTWKTNKAAVSEVVYAKDDGSNQQSYNEDSYGFEHSVNLSDMELSTIYVYRIIAKDRWGNEQSSDYFSMYTGEKRASIFDLIVSSIEDTFSWAMKK